MDKEPQHNRCSALTPTKVAESSIEQQTMGLLARFMSTAMQKLNGIAFQNDCELIFINQIREKMVMYGNWNNFFSKLLYN